MPAIRLRAKARPSANRGSVLVAVILGTIVLTTITVEVLNWSLHTLRDTKRKHMRQRLTLEANNEMELLFHRWTTLVPATDSSSISTRLAGLNVTRGSGLEATSSPIIVTTEDALLSSAQSRFLSTSDDAVVNSEETSAEILRTQQAALRQYSSIQVGRHLSDLGLSAIGTYEDGSSLLRKKASVSYYRARVRVKQNIPLLGEMEVRVGRRFVFLRATPFNKAVFYESNMEFGTGSNMDIAGDIQANGSIYIGSQGSATLRLSGNVYYYDKYNGHTSPTAGIRHVYNGPSTDDSVPDSWVNPVYDTTLNDAAPADQPAQRAEQVKKLAGKETFVTNGTQPEQIYSTWSTQSPPPYESVNDVYRAVIAPPPMNGSTKIPEDATVASNRMYNKASYIIAIENDDAGTVTVKDAAGNTVASLAGAVTSVRDEIADHRENRMVALTTLDVSQLKTVLGSSDEIKGKYNGVVYVYDKRAASDTTKGYAIRLKNAEEVPNYNDLGFVVASDNPVYVQGNFNTTIPSGDNELPRCAIMGDAITLLSDGWDDALSTHQLTDYSDLDGDPTNGDEYYDPTPRIATSDITINSAIVSGNTPTISATMKSGGVQNLVRYLENWQNRASTINGSLGQMFSSKYFNSYLTRQTALPGAASGALYNVGIYRAPTFRYLNFDRRLAEKPPSGTPSSRLSYYRGDLFTW